MKPVAIAGVLLAAASAPAAALETDVVLSGMFGASLSQFDSDATGSDVDVENNASRFGIFASTEEGPIKAFLHYDRAASNDGAGREDVREFFAGVTGAWGTATVGRRSTDYRLAGLRVDPFYDTSLAGSFGAFASEGASYGLSELTNNFFADNSLAYESPAFMGFTGNVAAYINNNSEVAGDEHDFGLGVGYANADWGLTGGVQYLDVGGPVVNGIPAGTTGSAVRLHGTFAWQAFSFGASVEQVDIDGEADARQYGFVSATYQLNEKIRLAAAVGSVNNTVYEGTGVTVGAFYEVFKNLNVYAGGRGVSLDTDDTTTFATGVSYAFDVDLE
ncbi:MAG: porin [Gammaproteobacteria bacterium]|nr:porin [Gammaproteobacteria bacterium]